MREAAQKRKDQIDHLQSSLKLPHNSKNGNGSIVIDEQKGMQRKRVMKELLTFQTGDEDNKQVKKKQKKRGKVGNRASSLTECAHFLRTKEKMMAEETRVANKLSNT